LKTLRANPNHLVENGAEPEIVGRKASPVTKPLIPLSDEEKETSRSIKKKGPPTNLPPNTFLYQTDCQAYASQFFYIHEPACGLSSLRLVMVKFGVNLPQIGVDYNTVKKVTLECERVGFDSVWLTDHLFPIDRPPQVPYLECWTTLSALAEATSQVRIGTMVLCNLYRHPPILAKMASTLDVISRGRLDFGLGAGWFRPEAEAYGVQFPKGSIRIAMLQEALEVLKKMWLEEKAVFEGKYYSIRGATCNPKPIQKPHPPIWIGTQVGGKLMYQTVAKYADGWDVGAWYLPSADEYTLMRERVKLYCQEVGRDFQTLKKGLGVICVLAKNRTTLKEKMRKSRPTRISIDQYQTTPKQISGTPDECAEALKRYAKAGVDNFTMVFPDATDLETIRLFGEQVIPHLK
jgi:alkanesulfonate monooxygenase SsuD/methylene tetrahydromethanopterin reductase-like flavin-dependent oxidoreductase (luciferase family)